MENKYNMTLEQNIFVAKRNIVDYIWKSAHLEGIDITFPETQKIYDGGNVGRLRLDEIVTINNLKHAWQFILSTIEQEIDFKYLCSINALVGSNIIENAGNLRSGNVKIGGTDWKPDLPDKDKYEEVLKELNFTYKDEDSIKEKIFKVSTKIYGAQDVEYSEEANKEIEKIEKLGYGKLPVCIAKTQYSFSDDPKNLECNNKYNIHVRNVEIKSGAGFIVVLAGKIMTMPGLPKVPAAESIDIDENGDIVGIF